jgi:hypothetical protein
MNQNFKHDMRLIGNGSRGNRLSGTLRASLAALKEHGRELVFENQGQAIRLLMRARDFSRSEAYWDVHQLRAMRLIKFEKPKDDLQPRLLEIMPAEPR